MKVDKSDAEWAKRLSTEQFAVLRQKATEAPFSGRYDATFEPGSYSCAACGSVLFDGRTKFDARCGWPSFYAALPGAVAFRDDSSGGQRRTEASCAACGGHLGHVFDGERLGTPTDRRYCINSLSLRLDPDR